MGEFDGRLKRVLKIRLKYSYSLQYIFLFKIKILTIIFYCQTDNCIVDCVLKVLEKKI